MSREGKGSNFKAEEDLLLSTCWVAVSQRTTEQNAETFWKTVGAEYIKHPGTTSRSPASLKCRWTTIQRVAQKFLAADKLYRANIPSGETEEDTKANVIKLYWERNATTDKDGKRKLTSPVKFLEAVRLLSSHPKFSAAIGGASSSGPGQSSTSSHSEGRLRRSADHLSSDDNDEIGVDATSIGNIGMAAPSRARPKGVKRMKAENAAEAGAFKMAKSIDRVGMAIENSTKAKLMASAVCIQLKIIQSMPLSEEEKKSKLMELLSKTSSMETSEVETSQRTGTEEQANDSVE